MQSKGKLLIVDDDPSMLESAGLILEDAGYTVTRASSGFGVTAIIIKEATEIVLLDVDMPGLSGDSLVKGILRAGRATDNILIVLHSAKSPTDLAHLVQECRADGFIPKGLEPELLVKRLERLREMKKGTALGR